MNNYIFDNDDDWMEIPPSKNQLIKFYKNGHQYEDLKITYGKLYFDNYIVRIRPTKHTTEIKLLTKSDDGKDWVTYEYGLDNVLRSIKNNRFKMMFSHPNDNTKELILKLQKSYIKEINKPNLKL